MSLLLRVRIYMHDTACKRIQGISLVFHVRPISQIYKSCLSIYLSIFNFRLIVFVEFKFSVMKGTTK